MLWEVEFHDEFQIEFDALTEQVQDAILARALLLQQFGPHLGRPHADTMVGSKHGNMKELRCDAGDGVWRVAYAFDPERRAVVLVAGDKSGSASRRFYKQLIVRADRRFDQHLAKLKR